MRLNDYLALVVTDLAAALPGASVAQHPGDFDLVELQRYRLCPPLVRVWMEAVLNVDRRRITCRFGAALVAKRTSPTQGGDYNVMAMLNALALVLSEDRIASAAGSQPEQIRAENRFERYAALTGMHFWRVQWQQQVVVTDPDADLADFLTLFATYQQPHGAVIVTDEIHIPQE